MFPIRCDCLGLLGRFLRNAGSKIVLTEREREHPLISKSEEYLKKITVLRTNLQRKLLMGKDKKNNMESKKQKKQKLGKPNRR